MLRRARRCAATLLLTVAVVPAVDALNASPASAAPYGQLILNAAQQHYGARYVYGATGPSTFDCSGFTGYIYRQFGLTLPRTSADQYNAVTPVAKDQAELGDLVFMYDGGGIYHVGIYAGNNTIYAATHTGDVVRPEPIWTSSYLIGRPRLGGDIGATWEALGGARSVLGQAVDLEHAAPGARAVDFQYGTMYWTPWTGSREVHGAIVGKYNALGGSGSALGVPVTDELGVANGRANRFVNGEIDWSPGSGAHSVQGAIDAKYDSLGGTGSLLGMPVTDETATTRGRASAFQFGQVTWGPTTGAFETHGAILARYHQLGGTGGVLGLPVSDERAAPGGRESAFQGGILRWDAATGVVTLIR